MLNNEKNIYKKLGNKNYAKIVLGQTKNKKNQL